MKKGTKITHKGASSNPDGDHDIKWNKSDMNEVDYNTAFDDKEYFFLHTNKGMLYGVDKLTFRNKRFLLLEPNPVTFYFSIANDTAMQIQEAYNRMEESLSKTDSDYSVAMSYSYVFKVTSICILFAYTACDAFLNQMLPDHKEIQIEKNGKPLNKKEIEWLPFEKKLKAVSLFSGKDFAVKHPTKIKKLLQLRDFRNCLTHLKEVKEGIVISYNDIYQEILESDLKRTVNCVKSFINFYEPGLIVNYGY